MRCVVHNRGMRILLLFCAITAALSAETFNGTLLPQKCRNDDPATHSRECGLDCASSGFGIAMENGDYVPFAESSQAKAQAFLKSISKEVDIRIRVTGTMDNKSIVIDTIKLDESPRKTS
jgi:hypothetical protein